MLIVYAAELFAAIFLFTQVVVPVFTKRKFFWFFRKKEDDVSVVATPEDTKPTELTKTDNQS